MIGETVGRIRAGVSVGVDRYNTPIPGADVEVPIQGAAFNPGGSTEPVEVGRASVVTSPTLFFRYQPDIISTDHMRVRGDLYSVQGNPALWTSPFSGSALTGLAVELKRVEG